MFFYDISRQALLSELFYFLKHKNCTHDSDYKSTLTTSTFLYYFKFWMFTCSFVIYLLSIRIPLWIHPSAVCWILTHTFCGTLKYLIQKHLSKNRHPKTFHISIFKKKRSAEFRLKCSFFFNDLAKRYNFQQSIEADNLLKHICESMKEI